MRGRMAVSFLHFCLVLATISQWRFSVVAFITGTNRWSVSVTRRNSGGCCLDQRAPSPSVVRWSSSSHSEGDGCAANTASANATKMPLFLEHMFREKGCEGERGDMEIRCDETTLHRRGLCVAAEEGISKGDYVFAVPAALAWVVEDDAIELCGELSDAQRGFRFWKWQQEQTQNEKHCASNNNNNDNRKPYFDILPTRVEAFDPTPDFWSEEEIKALELPTIVERALSKKRSVEALAAETRVDIDDLRFATWLVKSRAITIFQEVASDNDEDEDFGDGEDLSLTTKCVLVPLLDMINHSSEHPNAYFAVLGDDGNGDENNDDDDDDDDDYYDDDNDNLFYAVVADRDLRRGEEIFISYGSEIDSSVELLLQYGFVPETNPYDRNFWESFCAEKDNKNAKKKPPNPTKNIGNQKEEKGNNGPSLSFWTTTLQEDEHRLEELDELDEEGSKGSDIATMRKILEFRIRMKRAYAAWDEYRK